MNLNMSDKDRKKVDVFMPFDVQLVCIKRRINLIFVQNLMKDSL